ncbi:hypothetical protein SEPCBS119000_002086 [Sporothrix epigloea]|uniref:DUF7730 domain-containing protein n=1 Tax=Sporothrix epigloea TaxID=1892477 RepID=A0ABP0DGX7_9PEZI
MANCNPDPPPACWARLGLGADGKRKVSVRPLLSRWKRQTKTHDLLDQYKPLDDKASVSVAETGRSPSQSTYHATSSARSRTCSTSSQRPLAGMSKKVSQPVLRAIKSIRHFRLPQSISDKDLRSNTACSSYQEDSAPAMMHMSSDYNRFSCSQTGQPPRAATPVSTPRRPTQQASPFLALPQEIRDEIYAYVFHSTRLTMGRRVNCAAADLPASTHSQNGREKQVNGTKAACYNDTSTHTITHIRPARHTMALFLVCRQVTRELVRDNAWISQVLFNFEDVATMLDVLGGVFSSPEQRSLIREVRVREGGLFVHQQLPVVPSASLTPLTGLSLPSPWPPGQSLHQRFLLLGGLMRLLPGLSLDRLTILPALPCRVHKSTRCHDLPGVDMYHTSLSRSLPPMRLAASHEILAELLYAGSGWKELCYVHHDTAMLVDGKHRPSSLEALIGMRFPDAEKDTYEKASTAGEQCKQQRLDKEQEIGSNRFASQNQRQHPRHLGDLLAASASREQYRLAQWRRLLNGRDGWVPADKGTDLNGRLTPEAAATPSWGVSIDAVIHERSNRGDLPRSTIAVYGVRGGRALWPMETLEDVRENHHRSEEFMVVVRRGDNDVAEVDKTAKRAATQASSRAFYAEVDGSPYPFQEGDPRVQYGARWETLRPLLFPCDHLPATRYRRDRYQHRDEYVVRSQRRST